MVKMLCTSTGFYINPQYVACVYPTRSINITESGSMKTPAAVRVELSSGKCLVASEHETFEEAEKGVEMLAKNIEGAINESL